jgi:hypothetical protein
MQEKKSETKIGWFEREWDAFWDFFKRRKKLALAIVIVLCGYFIFTTAKTFWGIPTLNESHKTKIGEIADTRDKAIRERDDAFRERDKAYRERDDAARERDKYQIIQAAADRTFKDAPPEKRLDLLLQKVEGIEKLVLDTNRRLPQKRNLSDEAILRLQPAFASVNKNLAVKISFGTGVADGNALSKQLATFFKNLGFTNVTTLMAISYPLSEGVKAQFKEPLPPESVLNAFALLMEELGQEKTIYRSQAKNLNTNEALIAIGHQQ